MVTEGRTIREAQEAGTLFQVRGEHWAKTGNVYPWAETPMEAAQCLVNSLETWSRCCPLDGERIEVRRVIKHEIGFLMVEAEPFVYHYNQGGLL